MKDIKAWYFNLEVTLANDWLILSLVALFSYGIYQYLLDCSISENSKIADRSIVVNLILAGGSLTVAILSGAYLITLSLKSVAIMNLWYGILLGVLQGALFYFTSKFRFESRKYYSNNVVLPITKLSILIVIIMSWVLFDEKSITGDNLVGFALIGLAIYLFREFESNEEVITHDKLNDASSTLRTTSTIFLVLATISSAAIALLSKYAVGSTRINIALFIFISNCFLVVVSFILLHSQLRKYSKKSGEFNLNPDTCVNIWVRSIFKKGMFLGVFNLVAFSSLLYALSLNDASIVIPIYSLYIVIPVVLTAVLKGSELTPKTTVAVVLSIAAVIVIK